MLQAILNGRAPWARRERSGRNRASWSSFLFPSVSFDRGGERLVVRVDDEDREQLRRLGLARIAAD